MSTFRLKIATPDGALMDDEVGALFLRGAQGDLAVLPRHAAFVTSIQPGAIRVENEDGTMRKGECNGGLLSVRADGTTILASSFKWTEE